MSRDLSLIHPKLRALCEVIKAECEKQNLPVLFTDGMRTKAEQDALYAQGRTKPGTIVTNASYPNSTHNWGIAVDFCRNVKGKEYDDTDNFFARVGAIAKSFGLSWGGDWTTFVDKPHLQLKEFSPTGTTAYLRSTYGTPEKFIATWKKDESIFYDVPKDAWYYEALTWCVERGIIAGYEDGTFRPNEPVTRSQIVSIVYRAFAGKDK